MTGLGLPKADCQYLPHIPRIIVGYTDPSDTPGLKKSIRAKLHKAMNTGDFTEQVPFSINTIDLFESAETGPDKPGQVYREAHGPFKLQGPRR